MKIFTDSSGCIRDVGSNTLKDKNLIEIEVTDGSFDGMSKALICCYKVTVEDGVVVMRTPYVDSRLLYHIDQLGRGSENYTDTKTAYLGDTEITFDSVPSGNLSVYVTDAEGNYPNFTAERTGDRITVRFEPLEYVTTVTISIQ